jgi:hypothetical protein
LGPQSSVSCRGLRRHATRARRSTGTWNHVLPCDDGIESALAQTTRGRMIASTCTEARRPSTSVCLRASSTNYVFMLRRFCWGGGSIEETCCTNYPAKCGRCERSL